MPSRVSRVRNASLENPTMSLNDPAAWDEILGGSASTSGIKVSHESALSYAPVWQAVSIISGDVAVATLDLYKRMPGGDRDVDTENNAQQLVSTQWNEETSAFDGWRRLMLHALLWTNGYAYIRRANRLGEPLELLNLLPDRTTPRYDSNGKLFYITEVAGRLVPLFKEEVLHVKGLSIECGKGCDLVDKARNAIGLALAAEGSTSKFFANGMQAGGILEIPPNLTPKAKANLEEGWAKKYSGHDNWFKTVILRDGAKFHQVTIDAQKSQSHELREDQVRDVARFYNLPPFKLGISDSVSYGSAEQSQRVYLGGLKHWFVAVSSECDIKLLKSEERKDHFFEHNASKLIEIDFKTLNETLEIQRRNEIISANEWRRKVNLPKRTDKGGDEYVNPNIKSAPPAASGAKNAERDTRIRNAHRGLLSDAIDRMARRVTYNARRASKNPEKFCDWLDTGADEHRVVFDESVRPAVNVIAASGGVEAEPLYTSASTAFFSTLVASLNPFTEAPHKETDLATNVDRECKTFETTIAAAIIPLVIKETDHV